MASRYSMKAKLTLFFATLLILLLGLELVVRSLGIDFNPNPYWRYHPVLGWTQEKDRSFEIVVGGTPVKVEFNTEGFRDVEHSLEKPPGTRRLVILGDSFSEAIDVHLQETYWYRLQEKLKEATGESWEVINLGVGDYGNAQAWLALQDYGLAYQPDLVLVQIFPLNDICNNTLALAGLCKSQNDLYRPYLVESEEGLELTSVSPIRSFLRKWSVTFGVLEKAYLRARDESEPPVEERHVRDYKRRGFVHDPLILTYAREEDQPPELKQGWDITERILRRIDAVLTEKAIRWVALVIPFEVRVSGGWPSFASAFLPVQLIQDYPEQRLGRLFDQLGVPSVMMKPVFEANLDIYLPTRGGHLNPGAHELTAQAVLNEIMSRDLTK